MVAKVLCVGEFVNRSYEFCLKLVLVKNELREQRIFSCIWNVPGMFRWVLLFKVEKMFLDKRFIVI